MIKKSFLAAVLMLVGYHILLPHVSRNYYQIFGQRGNYLRAQQYVLDVPKETNVIIGSSMAQELNGNILGPGYFKLTLPGGSDFTALEMIRRANKRPAIVLIETNVVGRDADRELLHDLFSPWLLELRRRSNIFREKGRPANFVSGIAEACVRKICLITSWLLFRGQYVSGSSPPAAAVPQILMAKVMRIQEKEWDIKPSEALLVKQTNHLGDYVDFLNRNGSTCVFFEMPVDSSLSRLSSPRLWREAMNRRFPQEKYHWLSFAQDHNYVTRDGVHLIREDADRVSAAIVNYMDRLGAIRK